MLLDYSSRTALTLASLIALAGCSGESKSRKANKAAAASAAAAAQNNPGSGSTGAAAGATVRLSNMLTARGDHTATSTPQGVVAIGGESGGRVLDSIEVYRAGVWLNAARMSVARKGHTATALSNGKILIAGGQADPSGSLLLTACEVFDPATGLVAAGPALGVPRVDHIACAFRAQGREYVLIAGGISTGGTSVATAEVYDTSTGLISAIPARMIADRAGAEAILMQDGNVLIQGGLSGFSSGSITPRPAAAEIFATSATGVAPALSFQAAPGVMGINRFGAGLALASGNTVLVAGGNSGARVEATAEVFDVASGRWSNVGSNLSTPREGLSLTALRNGDCVAVGGSDGAPSSAVDLFSQGQLTALRPLQTARRGHSATLLPNGTVLLAGGFGSTGAIASCEEYDPTAAAGTKPPKPAAAPAPVGGAPQPGFPGVTPGQPGVLTTPSVLAILPATGKPGDLITIAGRDFAQNKNDNLVFFQGGAQGRVLYEARVQNLPLLGSVQTLIVEVPAGALSGGVVVVTHGRTSGPRNFTIDMQSGGTPQVLYTLPRRASPGGMVTIFGRNFARPAATNLVSFGGAPGNIVGGLTTQSVPFLGNLAVMVAVVPPNGVTGDLVVTSHGKVSAGYAFEVDGTTPTATTPGAPPTGATPGAPPTGPVPPTAPGATPSPGAATLYFEDFEAATVAMSEQGGLWEAARPGPNGPTQAASGQWCAGTAMVAGRYWAGANGFLTTPEIDLTTTTTAELRLNQWFDTDGFDAGRVLVSPDAGSTWYLVRPDGGYMTAGVFNPSEGFVSQSGGWLATTFDLSAYAGDRIMISFEFAADSVDERSGWFIDDVEVLGY